MIMKVAWEEESVEDRLNRMTERANKAEKELSIMRDKNMELEEKAATLKGALLDVTLLDRKSVV